MLFRNSLRYLSILMLFSAFMTLEANAQSIVINELYNSSSTDEWVEFVVVQDHLDLRGWSVRDFTGAGAAQPALVFSSDIAWSDLRSGTILVVARSENTFAEDLDPSDHLLVVKSNNAAYFSGAVFSLAGASDAVEISNASAVHIFGVSWGTANASSITDPKVHFTGTSSSNTSISYNDGDTIGITSSGNWTINNPTITLGAGNTAANTNWISSLRPGGAQIGTGIASAAPERWKFSTPTTVQIIVRPQADTLHGFRFVKPAPFSWNTGDMSVSPSASVAFSGDTTTVTGLMLGGTDSAVVTISGATASDTTDEFSFGVRSSVDDSTFQLLQTQPKVLVYGNPRPINVVKHKEPNGIHTLLGKWAVVRGIVTVGQEFGGPSYLQDSTAGMAVFDSSVTNNVATGDDVVLLGVIAPFNNLFEFAPCTLLEVLSEGNPVDTTVLTINQILSQGPSEPHEGRLVRINGITSVNTTVWSVSGSGTNYNIVDPTGSMMTRISPKTNLANLPAPFGTFDLVGVLGQFFNDYQLLPRSIADVIVEGQGPQIISQAPYETNVTSTSLTFAWQTNGPGTSTVKYGLTTAYGSELTDTNKVTMHELTVSSLWPATVYQVQLGSSDTSGTTLSPNVVVSTSSSQSSGEINVYFNKSIDASVALAETAKSVYLPDKLIALFNNAQYSIDICMYNMSGTVGANIAAALVSAKGRGLSVRVIGEKDTQGNAPWPTLKNAGVPVIDDTFDAAIAGAGLMHNKFIVIDNRDTSSQADDWVWTGSWNLSDPGTNSDLQNAIEIQDKALATAYTIEFNEMWGSDTDTPNAGNSRFGARKLDNTPHIFSIAGVPVQLYFSPSDRTTNQIVKTINYAQHSVNFCLLTFTRTDIANALLAKKNAGVKIRGVLDNGTDTGSRYDQLVAEGVDVHLDVNSGFLHHKYAVINAESSQLPQYVITGSHNWSSAAENSNNENTLIIESHRIANLYLQEFKARYLESGGTDVVLVSVEKVESEIPATFELQQNFPNPFNPSTTIVVRIAESARTQLLVYDVLGREVARLLDEQKGAGEYRVTWNASGLPSGVYFYRLISGGKQNIKRMLLIK